MLHVTRLTDRTGRYYLDDLAAELGVARAAGGGPDALAPGRPGRWTGGGAAGLGLDGEVEPGDLAAVLEGRRPGGGRPLVARRGGVAGYDLTFTAPKSVSLLFGLSSTSAAAEVVSAHDAAVESATGYVARRAAAVRRTVGDERRAEPARGVVAAAFAHGVSRALDPHLHTHVVVANLGHGDDGRWTALDSRGLYAHAPAAGDLYGAELRHRLTARLGVEWVATGHAGYELAGIPPGLVGTFSARRAEIRAELSGSGHGSRRAARVAWATTRDEKGGPGPEALGERWRAQAASAGWAADELAAVGRAGPEAGSVDEHRFAVRLGDTWQGGVTRRQAVGAWAAAIRQGSPVGDVERCADHLADWGDGVGVGEGSRPPADVVAPAHLLVALGPRPASPPLLEVWMEGASAVAHYRQRWGVTDRTWPLGVEGSGRALSQLPARRLADHLTAARRLEEARRGLGQGLGRWAEPAHLGLDRC